ncbi:MAG: hypothetical protein IKT71_03185 [Paludibacteraceae bacterium]|nr:hypothetical protein [Paludibacteraceae bacterium]
MTEAIGGYFELELRQGEHYHKDALRLNTARNCFEYILRARKYTKVYIPYYTCEVMLEPLNKCNVAYDFYHINEQLEPVEVFHLEPSEAFLYTNYYGLKQQCVAQLATQYGKQLIVDNAQAFFADPIQGIDTFYSVRKFFGVADGAYLYTDAHLDIELEQDQSYARMAHLLKRADIDAEAGYADFRKNDDALCGEPIKKMSRLTEKILCSIDYDKVHSIRRHNYQLFETKLGSSNKIHFILEEGSVPMIYPYWTNVCIRENLINKRIYTATYWQNVLNWTNVGDIENILTQMLIPLPININETEVDTIINSLSVC